MGSIVAGSESTAGGEEAVGNVVVGSETPTGGEEAVGTVVAESCGGGSDGSTECGARSAREDGR